MGVERAWDGTGGQGTWGGTGGYMRVQEVARRCGDAGAYGRVQEGTRGYGSVMVGTKV